VSGVILLLLGGVLLTSSVWTLPLVLVGALMVVTAWIGHRLEGRFAVEWGRSGSQLEFEARIRAPAGDQPGLPRTSSTPTKPLPPPAPAPENGEVIDGEAHTVEIEVAELRALIAAVETKAGGVEPPEATAEAIRILRVAADDARA
jgi:hypothetical protein